MLVWLGMNGCRRKTVARSDNLAQESLSRLGEMSRGSPRPFYARGRLGDQLSFERASVSLRRGESRLSENAQRSLLCVSSSRMGEGSSPERESFSLERDPPAFVKSWVRMHPELVSLCAWMYNLCLYKLLYDGLTGMIMHDWEMVICVNHEFGISFICVNHGYT